MMKKSLLWSLVAALVLAAGLSAQSLHSRHIKKSLVFYETHLKRLVHSVGPDSVVMDEDFVNFQDGGATADPLGWTTTVVEVGAGATELDVLDGSGGIARITTAANDNDGGNYQVIGEAFELTTDQELYCGFFGVTISDVTQSDFFLGLAVTDTTVLGGVTDRIGFQSVDAAATLTLPVEKDSTETNFATGTTLVDATAIDLEFYYDGAALEAFVDGVSVGKPAVTNLPDNEALRVSWAFLNGAAGAETMDVDTIRCIQIGR